MAGDQEQLRKELQEAREKLKEGEKREKSLNEDLQKVKAKFDAKMREVDLLAEELRKLSLGMVGCIDKDAMKWRVDVEEIGKDYIYSSCANIGGVPFRLGCKKEQDRLAVSLFCNEETASKTYAVPVAFTLRLGDDKFCNFFIRFRPSLQTWDWTPFTWADAVNPSKDVIQNGHFNIEAEIRVIANYKNAKVDLASPDPFLSDVVLLVGDRVFHSNKSYLSHYSEYFKVIFSSDFAEKKKKEIKLEEVDAGEFEELLAVIYPQRKKITAATVVSLLRLADFFDVHVVLRECTEFLKATPDFSLAAKLKLTEELRLPELQYHLVKSMDQAIHFKPVINSPEFRDLSQSLQKALLEKFFKCS